MQSGIVKNWNNGKGFGFITTTDGDDLFLHVSNLDVSLPANELFPGLRVKFDVKSDMKGDKAVNVKKA